MKQTASVKRSPKLIVFILSLTMILTMLPAGLLSQTASAATTTPYYSSISVTGISTTDAQLNGYIKNPSRQRIRQSGYILYDQSGKIKSKKYDNIKNIYSQFKVWFKMSKYYGKLNPKTAYAYQLYFTTSSGKTVYSQKKTFTTKAPATVTTPYYSSTSVTDLGSTDAQLNGYIKNPSRQRIRQSGYILYDQSGRVLSRKYDNIKNIYSEFKVWFNMNKYYGKLNPGTTYSYQLYFTTSSGKTVYTQKKSFTTKAYVPLTDKMNAFTRDANHKNGAAWAARSPMLSTYRSSGCCAYCADFVKYVYGSNNLRSGKQYKNINEIKAGDVIYISTVKNGKTVSQHWIVVISRNGNSLTTAEGNVVKKVRVKSGQYTIKNGTLTGTSGRTFRYGYHYTYKG